ncbi:hypothetical protein RvY_05557 [Ramazzottius varieornatus]|uniref:DUF7869 domain-containing protein n=1 Tax=Ramazzottius varieornatus TaxID=947166 RepID=A0A1D1V117_RAMVA|nr:hypothetical protein RvY_05557 [Ramazzottius varieornatus]
MSTQQWTQNQANKWHCLPVDMRIKECYVIMLIMIYLGLTGVSACAALTVLRTNTAVVMVVEGDQDGDDSSDDESEIGHDAEDTSDDEQEYMSVEEQEARKCGEITYCLPAFPDIDVTELNEEDEQPVPDRTVTEEDILQMDVDINDDVGVFSNDRPDAVWWQEIETELFDENPEKPSTSTASAKAAPSTASFSSEEKSHGKPWVEAIEQSRYTDFVSKHHACTKQCHAILTQEQLMGRRKSIRSLGYHARSVFLVSQVMTAFPLDRQRNAKFLFSSDRQICREAFVYANDITKSRLYKARKLVSNGSFGNLQHGLAGAKGTSALKKPQIEGVLRIHHGPRDDTGKQAAKAQWEAHLEHAAQQRAQKVLMSKLQYKNLDPESKKFSTTDGRTAVRVVSFDFAQSVGLPHHTDQAGAIYFKSPLGVHIFGLVDESNSRVYYFFMNESNCIGLDGKNSHSPNSVLSMLDFFLKQSDNGERNLCIYADNCTGQNKNRFTMGYLAHLIKTGRYDTIEILFLPPGHMKFSPDAFFGLLKRIFRRFSIGLPHEMKTEIATKAASSHTFDKDDEPEWIWNDIKTFAEDRYESVPGINGSYHFKLHRDEERDVILRHCAKAGGPTTEVLMEAAKNKTSIVRTRKLVRQAPVKVLETGGFSATRAKELLKQVLEHVTYNKQDEWKTFIITNAPAPPAVAVPERRTAPAPPNPPTPSPSLQPSVPALPKRQRKK